jgi:hypothetical protein
VRAQLFGRKLADQEIKAFPHAEISLPLDPKGAFLGNLFVLAMLATADVANEVNM